MQHKPEQVTKNKNNTKYNTITKIPGAPSPTILDNPINNYTGLQPHYSSVLVRKGLQGSPEGEEGRGLLDFRGGQRLLLRRPAA